MTARKSACVFLLYVCAERMSNIRTMNSLDELASLRYELRQVEARIREDILERHLAWLELAREAMVLVSRMILETIPSRGQQRAGSTNLPPEGLPVPHLEPRTIDVQEFRTNTPEKFELLGGYLFDTAEHPDSRRRLLALLLVNVGLLEVVRLAPQESWLEALERAYKS